MPALMHSRQKIREAKTVQEFEAVAVWLDEKAAAKKTTEKKKATSKKPAGKKATKGGAK